MKKLILALLAAVSFSAAAPGWILGVGVKEVWVAPGPTSVVRIKTSEASNQYYVFFLDPAGNKELLSLAQTAIQQNLLINIYADKYIANGYSTGLSSPDVAMVTGYPLYTLSIVR
jgi:hypothetical protein